MVYGTLAGIREILNIKATDSKSDAELLRCQNSAYAAVNNILKKHNVATPLEDPDQNIIDAENYFAASFFREKEDSAAAEKLHARAEYFITVYLGSEDDIAFVIGTDET